MKALAQCSRVAVKLSGWEMQCRDWHWRSAQSIVVETVAIFGVSRVMLASNFPLSNWRHSYQALWLQYEKMLAQFTLEEKCSLLANNTARWYGLNI
jgi:L-fuconolactonase